LVDFGRDYRHFGRIFPFYDRPERFIYVLWSPCALDTPGIGIPTIFNLRNWDRLEQLEQTTLGTDQDYTSYFHTPFNVPPGDNYCGSAEQWLNGVSYEDWINDRYTCSCPTVPCTHREYRYEGGMVGGGGIGYFTTTTLMGGMVGGGGIGYGER
jgi:hypothetical protein